ncbi:MAG TPA: PilZ domain-containing protein [Nitrospiraceae bacterium]|nr:PilZ domain-containing protein [Nitrospiraceae bacterium]
MDATVKHRKHPRYPVFFKCIFSTDGVRFEDGVVLDLSLGGCRLMSEMHVSSGISLVMHIRPDQHSAIYIPRAVVRWVGDTVCGMQFTDVPEPELATLTRLLWTLRA